MKPSGGSSNRQPRSVQIRKKEDGEAARTSIADGLINTSKRQSSIRISTRKQSDNNKSAQDGNVDTGKSPENESKELEGESVVAAPPAIGSADLSEPVITASSNAADTKPEGVEPDLLKQPDLARAGEASKTSETTVKAEEKIDTTAEKTASETDGTGTKSAAEEESKADLNMSKTKSKSKSDVSISSLESYGSPTAFVADLATTSPQNDDEPSVVKSEDDVVKQEADASGKVEEDTKTKDNGVEKDNLAGKSSTDEKNDEVGKSSEDTYLGVNNSPGKLMEGENLGSEKSSAVNDNLKGESSIEGKLTEVKSSEGTNLAETSSAEKRNDAAGKAEEVAQNSAEPTPLRFPIDGRGESASKVGEGNKPSEEISKEELEYILSKDKQESNEGSGKDGGKTGDDDEKDKSREDGKKKKNEDSSESTNSKKNTQLPVTLGRTNPSENLIERKKTSIQPGTFVIRKNKEKGYNVKMAVPEKILAFNTGAKVSGRYATLMGKLGRCNTIRRNSKTDTKKNMKGHRMIGGKNAAANEDTMPLEVDGYLQNEDSEPQYQQYLGSRTTLQPPPPQRFRAASKDFVTPWLKRSETESKDINFHITLRLDGTQKKKELTRSERFIPTSFVDR
ncbi:hypothetical protein GE061_010481 [Apolygus lucorum]|uniref:Uncharacterized protein n=1 Tax=Apolygus lucorum TaxID=248454 RepID=A0A6A4JTZ8_APOLU|nr:hypothetical protein GE061_010481 [Apolygus lucorum]